MRPFFSPHFHAQNRRPQVIIDESTYQDTPLRTKEYPRFTQIPLSLHDSVADSVSTKEALRRRTSAQAFSGSILLSDLSTLLIRSMEILEEKHRSYPSGGARYPIEAYVVVREVESVPTGLYHFNPVRCTLEELLRESIAEENYTVSAYLPYAKSAAATLLLTSVWDRSSQKYGEGAYQLALLEAGHIMQNILLVATTLDIAARPMAGFNDEGILELLDIEIDDESPVYMCFLGKEKKE